MSDASQNRLVVFDVEGVLIPKIRFMFFEVAGRMGPRTFLTAAIFGILYEVGLISLKDALKYLYRLFKGLPLERFLSLFQEVPFMPDAESAVEGLRADNFKVALISSSIPRIALEQMSKKIRADFVSGLEIGLYEGRLTGEIWGDVIEREGKVLALGKILKNGSLSPCYCVGVADDRNNLPMFRLCNLKIGYNPDFVLAYKSDYVVRGELSAILPIIRGEQLESHDHTLARSTIFRETIHIGGFLVPVVCKYLLSYQIVVLLVFGVMILYTVSEIRRMFGMKTPVFSAVTKRAARKSEYPELVAAPAFYALGIVFPLIIFAPQIGYASVAVLTFGDGFASIFGRKFGNTNIPFNKGKYLEGTIFGFLFAFAGSLLFVTPFEALVASAAGMLFEALPLPLNDNLTIPLASGLALTALAFVC